MSESVNSLVIGLIAAAAAVYLGFKVRQDRDRLRRIVGIIDAEHSFDMRYLCMLADSGELSLYSSPPVSTN